MGSRILIRQDDGILAAQRRLRELGRIRTGWSEPYTKDGRQLRRPVRSKTIVLTSAQRGCLDAAAQEWGGTVERWQPQGNNPEVWRLVTERDGIEAILPPGDPLNQTLEMWSGGGCVRRCDGVTEKLTNKPCLCLAQFGPDFYEQKPKGGVPQVCRPHSRLSVFLDLPDFGLWRIETHSYYAMLEMAGTIDMIKARVGFDVVIPIRLRIDPRTRLVDGKSTGYPVIVVELLGRGVVAQILSGTVDGLAIEAPARQAIEAVAHDEQQGAAPIQPPKEPTPDGLEPADRDRDWPTPQQAAQYAAYEHMINAVQPAPQGDPVQPLRQLWRTVAETNDLTRAQVADLTQVFWAAKARIDGRPAPASARPAEETAEEDLAGVDYAVVQEAAAEGEPDRVKLWWMEMVAIAGRRGWDSEQLVEEMIEATGRKPEEADPSVMEQFLTHLRGPS